MTTPVLEVRGVGRHFPAHATGLRDLLRRRPVPRPAVLRSVDLELSEGQWYCLIGQNGTGKTTLLRIVAGLLRPSAGRVLIDGQNVEERRGRPLAGYALADERSFHWRLSAFQNLRFFARLEGLSSRDANRRVDQLLEGFDLESVRDRSFAELSTGMRQRLAIARGLIVVPRVLLMDEPTRSLDLGHAADAMHVVRAELRQTGGCVLMVTHQLEQALAEADRIGVLHQGVIVEEFTPASLATAAGGAEGVTVSVRGMPTVVLASLRAVAGVRDIRVASSAAGEQVLEVWASDGGFALDRLIGELTDSGASITGLQRGTPLQALIEKITALRERVPA